MPRPFDPEHQYQLIRRRIIGLGERTVRKSYYPQLRQRLEELKRSAMCYRALFEASPISLWEEDVSRLKQHFERLIAEGVQNFGRYFGQHPEEITRCIRMIRIVDVNRVTLDLYEADSKADLLRNTHRILPRTSQNVHKQELVAMAEEGRFEIECGNLTLKGHERHLLIKSSIPPGFENNWKRVFISVYDLTERIEAEEEKKALGRQLRQAQKMDAVGTLAGGIAHDVNHIPSAVIGFTEMAMEDAPSESFLQHNMTQVRQAGLCAKHLVRQILTFSRQSEHELRPVQLGRIVQEACELLRASLPTTIDICTDIGTDAFTMGDPTQMHQVLMNLCTNAGHAMRDRGGRLTISLREAGEKEVRERPLAGMNAEAYLALTVEDTGHGIPAAILERIFDPFFTTKEHSEGTGMGLPWPSASSRTTAGRSTWKAGLARAPCFGSTCPWRVPEHRRAIGMPCPCRRAANGSAFKLSS